MRALLARSSLLPYVAGLQAAADGRLSCLLDGWIVSWKPKPVYNYKHVAIARVQGTGRPGWDAGLALSPYLLRRRKMSELLLSHFLF